jgi:hypothetical protein
MKALEEVGEPLVRVGHHEMLVGRHQHERMELHPKLLGTYAKRIEIELGDCGVGAEEVMSAEGAASDHARVASEDHARLGHA